MGLLASIQHYHEIGEEMNPEILEMYGQPVHTLYSTSKLASLHRRMEITDANENVIYVVESKPISLHDKTDISTVDGRPVAHIERKVLSLHQTHYISMANGTQFELSAELFHLVKDVINIPELNWQIQGNIMALNFELYDQNENIIALISQKMVSIHDKYCIDIYQPQYEEIVVAILITLQHMIRDRQNSSLSSSSSSTE